MPTFCYSPNQNPPAPPAYILKASAATSADSKWYDPNRTWGEWLGWSKKPTQPTQPTIPTQSDDPPYDHEYPFGVDPNDPSKPYAPYGFYCDENGNPTTTPNCTYDALILREELGQYNNNCPFPWVSDPLNAVNIDSPMDPYNMSQFFYPEKPGSPWHQYERELDESEQRSVVDSKRKLVPCPIGYRFYSYEVGSYYEDVFVKDTPENLPWSYDADPSHHYRRESDPFRTHLQDNQSTITAKIYLDSPVAPVGWQEVQQPTAPAQ